MVGGGAVKVKQKYRPWLKRVISKTARGVWPISSIRGVMNVLRIKQILWDFQPILLLTLEEDARNGL